MKVEVVAMHLDGDALDLYARINGDGEILLWEELVKNGTFVRNSLRVAKVRDWPDYCLLGVFLTGLKAEL
ncbi:hypothetical protein V2J09_013291 [Rumex salicifolius]